MYLLERVKVPKEMLADGEDPNSEWGVWKLIESTVTDEELKNIEDIYGIKFPIIIKAFLSTYHHLFDYPIGDNGVNKKLNGFKMPYNHHLTANNMLPFAWDKDNCFIRFVDLTNMPDEEKCPVFEIDHEYLFDIMYDAEANGEIVNKEQLLRYMRPVSDNFYKYLDNIYNDLDK
ncbi:MAG: hypothetical protein BWY78_00528 [Alphaproteobacteria bacterium ADurb.Bin438]|nr:MAG: hypothetical protein BWY78_00528 [Alphaproteobacteria bacterium ADurb.Bin438]